MPHHVRRACRARLSLIGAALASVGMGASAQTAPQAPLAPPAGISNSLLERLPLPGQEPIYVIADQTSGMVNIRLDASGHVQVRKHSVVLKADHVHDDLVSNLLDAEGHVRLLNNGNLFTGPSLQLNLDSYLGQMPNASYAFARTGGHGDATDVHFLGPDHLSAAQASYSTCTADPLDWVLNATRVDLDFASNTGVAHNGSVRFLGVPILPLPYASFPLSDERKSGLLPPTLGIDSRNGFSWAQPYYWNIAPNYDATFTPRLLQRRGLLASLETRWLEPNESGTAEIDDLPSDNSSNGAQRWAALVQQNGRFSSSLGYGLNLQRVSDNNWWQDLGTINPVIAANRTLPQQGTLNWQQGNASAQFSVSTWQTLQTSASPIAVPYNIAPQLTYNWNSPSPTGLQWQFSSQAARFTNSTPGMLTGDRAFVVGSVSRPFASLAGFITPKLSLNATQYSTDTAMADGTTSASRVLPTVSLDSGLVFERDTRWFGQGLTQTLEPRLAYVYTPYRNQQSLPNYDSAPIGLNVATLFSDNAYSGHDRIADADNLTYGVTSRLLDSSSGAQLGQVALAQRLMLRDQLVTTTGTPQAKGLTDTYALADLTPLPHWTTNAGIDYNLRASQLVAATLGAGWQPQPQHTYNLSYQLQSASATQIPLKYVNLSWQSPLLRRWSTVGQANYSVLDHQLNAGLFGVEYDGGCWVARVVVQRNALTSTTASTSLMLQLELSGFSRLGNNPLSTLQQNIPGYQLLHPYNPPTSRYANYE